MKNLLYLALFVMVFVSSCGDDDDGGNNRPDDYLEITLSWDQADADLDLDLTLPNGGNIGAGDMEHSGDVLTGPGEEKITFPDNAEDGGYVISIEWFEGAGDVSYTVIIDNADGSRSVSGTLNITDDIDTTEFSKSGRNLTF